MADIEKSGRDTWSSLRSLTPARIALGRAGGSLPTGPLLQFQLDHARARDAVHAPFDAAGLCGRFTGLGWDAVRVSSLVTDRKVYLQRPDLGRRLDDGSRETLEQEGAGAPEGFDVAFVIADGLSPRAVERHAVPVLERVRWELLPPEWTVAPLVVAEGGRVALGDEIGEILRARLVVVLIGERPGLSSPDSLGIYVTFAPRPGRTDAERNCISNVRPEGLPCHEAAAKLVRLMRRARRDSVTGVGLKDDCDLLQPAM